MNMKCAICGSDKFHVDVDQQRLSCTSCSFYCDFRALVRSGAVPQPQVQRPAYNPADFEIVGGVLKKYKGAAIDVVVPDGVIEIDNEAFYCLKHLNSVKLPKGVKNIGSRAFLGCDSLKSVELPDTLEVIGFEAFKWCKSLVNIHLPEGLKSIGGSAFSLCESIKNINIPNSVEQIHTTSIHWGSGYRDVNDCFHGCANLASITYPKGRFSIHTFDGSLFYRRDPEGQRSLIRRKKCPDCMADLGMFKKCKSCGKSW